MNAQVLEALAEGCERPVVLPLSRVSPEGRREAAEVSAADALAWTQVPAPLLLLLPPSWLADCQLAALLPGFLPSASRHLPHHHCS